MHMIDGRRYPCESPYRRLVAMIKLAEPNLMDGRFEIILSTSLLSMRPISLQISRVQHKMNT
jgi:hypothetical protein